MIYFAKTIKVTALGHRMVECACEKCKTRYVYQMARVAREAADAPFGMGQKSAQDIAEYRANVALHTLLENDRDLVACPKCGWVNSDAVQIYQRRCYRILATLAIAVAILGLLTTAGYAIVHLENVLASLLTAGIGLLATGCLAVTLLQTRAILRRRLDPNLFHPKWPELPPGTPEAISLDASGNPISLARRPTSRKPFDGWALFQSGRHVMPVCCCQCLGEATTVFSMPFKVNAESDVGVPLCKKCLRQLVWKWWGVALLTCVAAGGISLSILLVPARDAFGRWFFFGLVAFFLTSVTVAIVPGKVVRPFRMRKLDGHTGTYAFRFNNEAYTRLLAANKNESPAQATIASASISI